MLFTSAIDNFHHHISWLVYEMDSSKLFSSTPLVTRCKVQKECSECSIPIDVVMINDKHIFETTEVSVKSKNREEKHEMYSFVSFFNYNPYA